MNTYTVGFLLIILPAAQPSQGNHPVDEFNDFKSTFDKLDEQERFNEAIDQGFERWEQTCLKNGGPETRDRWLKSQENMVHCFMNNFNFIQIQAEIEEKKPTGDLDEVFQKYCGTPVKNTRPCIENFIDNSFDCTKMDKSGVNITMAMFDSAVDFMCVNNGDKIALFVAEKGMACVEEQWTNIVNCLNSSAPDFFQSDTSTHKKSWFTWLMFDQSQCRSGDIATRCVEQELLKCADSTTSNIVSSMMQAMRNASPCRTMSARASQGSTNSSFILLSFPSFVIASLIATIVIFVRNSQP